MLANAVAGRLMIARHFSDCTSQAWGEGWVGAMGTGGQQGVMKDEVLQDGSPAQH